MAALKSFGLCVLVCLPLAALILPNTASGMPVESSNGVIHFWDDFYIPMTPQASGVLGEVVGSRRHKHVVGLEPDSLVLSPLHNTSSGFVSIVATFDISQELTEASPVVDPNSDVLLTLVFRDLDLLPVTWRHGKLVFSEWLEVLPVDAEGAAIPGASPFSLNSGNYLTFRQDTDGSGHQVVKTDGILGTYELSLASMFDGNDAARDDFLNLLNEEQRFSLKLTLHAEVAYLGSGRVRLLNMPENLGDSSILFSAAPEPGALGLILAGIVGLALRRRRTAKG